MLTLSETLQKLKDADPEVAIVINRQGIEWQTATCSGFLMGYITNMQYGEGSVKRAVSDIKGDWH